MDTLRTQHATSDITHHTLYTIPAAAAVGANMAYHSAVNALAMVALLSERWVDCEAMTAAAVTDVVVGVAPEDDNLGAALVAAIMG